MTYVIFGLVVAVTLVPVVVFVVRDAPDRPTPSPGSAEPSLEGRLFTTAETLKMPAFWAIAVVFGMMLCVFGAVMLHLYSHLVDQGMSTYQAATVLSVVAGCSALGKPAVGAMADWLGGRPTIWFALALQFIAMLIIAAVDTYAMALTAAVIYGFGYSGILPLRSFAMAATVGHRSFGSANGLLRPAMWPLQVSASPLAGYIYDQSGSYETAFYVLAGFVAVAALGPFFIPSREESAEPAGRRCEATMEQPATGK